MLFHHHMASQAHMIEKQVDEIISVTYGEFNLVANKGEPCAKFEQKLPDMGKKVPLGYTLMRLAAHGQKIEVIKDP